MEAKTRITNKAQKKKRTRRIRSINVGVFVLVLVAAYFCINVLVALNKEHLSIYEVQAVNMSQDDLAEAVIVRNEVNFYTSTAGYTNFYVRSGSRIAVGDTIYSIDESKNVYEYLSEYETNLNLDESTVKDIKTDINVFYSNYSSDNFEAAYDLKDKISALYSNVSDTYLLDHLDEIISETNNAVTFNVVKSSASGIVSFFSDSLDGLKAEDVNLSTFDKKNYKASNLYDSDLKQSNSLIYKVISDDNWSIIINLSEEQYNKLSNKSTIEFTIMDDGLKIEKAANFYSSNGAYFARIDLNNYLIRYIKNRFVNIKIKLDNPEGLKIPTSSLTTKDFYVIPSEYYKKVDDDYGFVYLHYDKNTKTSTYEFVKTDIYYNDEDNGVVYVDVNDIDFAQYVYDMEGETMYQVSVLNKLTGVYNVNRGYAVFRRVNIIQKKDDYCIVKMGENNSLCEHDHIALNSKLINEKIQIY